jgi:hypothetical protein
MRQPIDAEAFAAAGLEYTRNGNIATFALPTEDPEITKDVTVACIGDDLDLIPERSAGHRQIITMLGIARP